MNYKISVIIPIYNVSKWIERCSRSLFEQTLDGIEYIFVNDSTPDDSIQILRNVLKDYPSREPHVQIINHDKNRGLTASRNTGLSFATGIYIAHCDSDDWLELDAYEKMYNNANDNNADICFCNFNILHPSCKQTFKLCKIEDQKDKTIESWINNGMTSLWCMIVKRNLYERYKLCSPIGLTYCEDFHLTVRMFYYASKISKVDDYLYNYNRLNVNSLLNSYNEKNYNEEKSVYLDIINFFSEKGKLQVFEKVMSWRLLKCSQQLVLDNNRFDEFKELFPPKNRYILSIPDNYCNLKIKILMWLVVNRFEIITKGINLLRNFLKR